ncbi:MAG TPA: hypothetical protein VGN88_11090 [Phycisphaerae bacterium]
MKSEISSSFLTQFAALPVTVQLLARKNYQLWKENPSHPGLQFKRVGRRTESYSVRIGLGWRVVGVKSADTIIWFWIGSHADYDKIVDTL